jgi:hypothetical protein
MPRVDHLPIYKSSYAYCKEIFKIKNLFPKSLKHELGQDLFRSAIRVQKLIISANLVSAKSKYLQELVTELELHWTFLRMSYDFKAISKGQFSVLSEQLTDLQKQAIAWSKWELENLKKRS